LKENLDKINLQWSTLLPEASTKPRLERHLLHIFTSIFIFYLLSKIGISEILSCSIIIIAGVIKEAIQYKNENETFFSCIFDIYQFSIILIFLLFPVQLGLFFLLFVFYVLGYFIFLLNDNKWIRLE